MNKQAPKSNTPVPFKTIFITTIALAISLVAFTAAAPSVPSAIRVKTVGITGISVTGVPHCSGKTDKTLGYYDCKTSNRSPISFKVPVQASFAGQNWQLIGQKGCKASLSGTCQVEPKLGSTIEVIFTYGLSPGGSAIDQGTGNFNVDNEYTATAVPGDNLPTIAYYSRHNPEQQIMHCDHPDAEGECDLKFVKCGDASCSSANQVVTLDSYGDVGLFASMAIGKDGLPVIAYYEGASGAETKDDGWTYRYCEHPTIAREFCNLKVIKCGNSSCTLNNIITRLDSTGMVGQSTAIAIGSDGLPVITYTGGLFGQQQLKVVKCGNPDCSQNNNIAVGVQLTDPPTASQPALIFSTTASVDKNNLPVVGYLELSYLSLNGPPRNLQNKILKCGNPSCAAGNITTAFDEQERGLLILAKRSSVALGSSGLPVFSYNRKYDQNSQPVDDLKMLFCADPACSSSQISTLDAAGNTGQTPALAIGSDGLPATIYRQEYGGGLSHIKFLKCTTSNCSANNTTRIIGDVGVYSFSMALDDASRPAITYWQRNLVTKTHTLKLLKCANPACTNSTTSTVSQVLPTL